MNIALEFRVASQQNTIYLAFQNIEEREEFYEGMKELVSDHCVTAE
jgi:hypothetical protein